MAELTQRHSKPHKKSAVLKLEGWLASHLDYPYPTESEKAHLAKVCFMTPIQVGTWFTNKRQRFKEKLKKKTMQSNI